MFVGYNYKWLYDLIAYGKSRTLICTCIFLHLVGRQDDEPHPRTFVLKSTSGKINQTYFPEKTILIKTNLSVLKSK